MAEIVVGIVGAGIGFALGGPAGAWKGFQIGVAVGSLLFPPLGPDLDGGKIDDLRVQSAQQGSPIAIVYGRNRIAGTVIWASGLKERKDTSGGRKGGGGGGTTTEYLYSTNLAILVCEGTISKIRRIWANEKVIYDWRVGGSPIVASWIDSSKIRVYPGSQTLPDSLIEADKGAGNVPAHKGMCYVVFEDLQLKEVGNQIPNFSFEIEPSYTDLKTVMEDVASRTGLLSTDYDFTALAGMPIRGFVVSARTEGVRIMDTLAKANFFEIVETGGKIKAVIRSGTSVLTIPSTDIGASADEQPRAWVETIRSQEVELPRLFEVNYSSEAQDFQNFTQAAKRFVRWSENQDSLTFPMALSEAYARFLADAFLMEVWVARMAHSFTLPYKYLHLDPGDVIMIPDEAGSSRLVRIVEMNAGLMAEIEVKAVDDDPVIYVDPGLPAAIPPGINATVDNPNSADLLVFETAAPTDDLADSPQLGWVAGRGSAGWLGGNANISPNIKLYTGYYTDLLGISYSGSTFGYTTYDTNGVLGNDNLPDGTSIIGRLDTQNKVRITMTSGTPTSCTYDEMVKYGKNPIIIGKEILHYQTATLISGTTYELSNLLRYRRGTDRIYYENLLLGTGLHAQGDGVVFLNAGAYSFAYDPQEIGVSHSFRLIESGKDYSAGLPYFTEPLVGGGDARKPYSPVNIRWTGDRTSGNADVVLSWTRRVRKNGDLVGYVDAILDEDTEGYIVEIWNNTFSALLRTITGITSPTTTYTIANQTTDGVNASTFGVRVYQTSTESSIGQGFGSTDLVSLAPSVQY